MLHEGRLWGLIACHHYSYKYIDNYTRINAQLQGHFLTSQIDIRQTAEEYAISREVNAALENLLNQVFVPERASLEQMIRKPELLTICNAAGVAILLDDVIYKNGQTPPDADIRSIAGWAVQNHKHGVFSTSKLADAFTGVSDGASASGIIFCALSSLTEASITWFNPETLEEINWAGDPEKAIIKDENGLHPRKSFETWKQVVRNQAREWVKPELTAATNFAYALQKHITLLLLAEEGIRQQQLADKLKESNAELENINWLSTHDLKEPLRKIQMFASRLLTRENNLSPNANATLQKMDESAKRMQKLIEDLMSYAKLRQSGEGFQKIDLAHVLEEIRTELQEETSSLQATIEIPSALPTIEGVPVFIHELFANLIRNALKFSKPGTPPLIQVSYKEVALLESEPGKTFYQVIITDNGIGFDNKYNQDIFKIFTRLSHLQSHEGSGIGLALCKKIMQMHNGYITAEGRPDEGASFSLYFP